MYLRRRFVLGAADWMAGNNGSLQNDKLVFDYTDDEWELIWKTMLEDAAWAVPGIKDAYGNVIKENYAPEILIKFIAHDLKCNILVFDLLLNSVQYVSGNHLKLDNVQFDSPLLLYATGSHFQSVVQQDHEFFVKYSEELEAGNQLSIPTTHENRNTEVATNVENKTPPAAKPKSDVIPMKISKFSSPRTERNSSQVLTNKKKRSDKESKRKDNTKIENRFSTLSTLEGKCVNEDEIYEMVKTIKARDRTEEQQKLFLRVNRKKSRERKTAEEKAATKAQDKTNKAEKRKGETDEQKGEGQRK